MDIHVLYEYDQTLAQFTIIHDDWKLGPGTELRAIILAIFASAHGSIVKIGCNHSRIIITTVLLHYCTKNK